MQKRQSLGNNRIGSCNPPPPRPLTAADEPTDSENPVGNRQGGIQDSSLLTTVRPRQLSNCDNVILDIRSLQSLRGRPQPRTHVTHLQQKQQTLLYQAWQRHLHNYNSPSTVSFLHGGIACGSRMLDAREEPTIPGITVTFIEIDIKTLRGTKSHKERGTPHLQKWQRLESNSTLNTTRVQIR